MEIKMKKVKSSNVNFIGRSKSGVTVIEFKGGSKYRYDKIPEETYDELKKAKSKGRFIYSRIRSLDSGRRILSLKDEGIELIYPKEGK